MRWNKKKGGDPLPSTVTIILMGSMMGKENKLSIESLKDVPETLLYPLKSRYVETKKKDGVISDPKSVEILDELDYDPAGSRLNSISQLGVCLRTLIFDEQAVKFMRANPDGIVVNIGCGLDTRFSRIDNGSVRWFDLDLPEAINIRRHFFLETARHRFISKSVLDPAWHDEIPKSKKKLFLIEGLSLYLTEKENRQMFDGIRRHFPGAECLIELMADWNAKMLIKTAQKIKYDDALDNKTAALVKWGINKSREIETWSPGINFVEEWFVVRRNLSVFPWKIKILFFLLPVLSKATKIAHFRFA
jgi:O-methyltransferase involved in polyketide biosynthesis